MSAQAAAARTAIEAATTAAQLARERLLFDKERFMDTEPIMQFFACDHLPPHLQAVSQPFANLAAEVLTLPRNPERSVALRKLLEAKDAAVRAKLAKTV